MKKVIKYITWITGIILVLVASLFLILKVYVSTHKKELLEKINAESGKIIGGNVSVADISVSPFKNFPNLAIQLKEIDVKDSLFTTHGHALFHAQNVYLRLNTLSLLIGKISINKLQIDSGAFDLFTDTGGYTNGYLLKIKQSVQTKEETTSIKKIFDQIEISRFTCTIQDLSKQKLFNFYINRLEAKSKTTDSSIELQIKKSILVKSMAFHLPTGTYLANHLLEGEYAVRYLPQKNSLTFSDIPLTISGQLFHMTGLFVFGEKQTFELSANTNRMLVDFAKTILTKKIQRSIDLVSLTTPIDAAVTITGSLAGGNPVITAHWKTEKNILKTPLLNFSNCSFEGIYTNQVIPGQPTTDENSKVELTKFTGDWEGLTTKATTIQINNLTTPVVTADLRSDFSLTSLNSVIQSESLSLTKGTGALKFIYKGPLDHITTQNASLDGSLTIKDGNIFMTASRSNLENCNADLRFRGADLFIDALVCNIQKNPILFRGKAQNVLTILGDSRSPVHLSLDISAPLINVGNISSILYRKFPAKKRSASVNRSSLSNSIQKIDELLSRGNILLNLSADKLLFHRFEAKKAVVSIFIDQNSWHLKKAALLHGNGSLSVTGKVTELANGHFILNAGMQMKNLDAQKIWYQFENFGIPAPTDKNIRGILSADANMSLRMDKAGRFDLSSLSGNADFSIKNGVLLNFKPLEQIQEFAFRKRDFSNVSFAEIKDKLSFSRGEIAINRMEINSSVLSLYVEGVYGLQRNSDISIQVPLSNLKKRDKDYTPENTGADRKGGISIFLRATSGADGVMKLKYDPFKRFRKSPLKKIKSN